MTATELFSLTLVLGATIGDLFDPIGRQIAADAQARVRLDRKDLEALVDEYYEASGVDPRRLVRLKVQILDLVRDIGLDSDAGIHHHRFENHGGHLPAMLDERAGDRLGVVERHRDHQIPYS